MTLRAIRLDGGISIGFQDVTWVMQGEEGTDLISQEEIKGMEQAILEGIVDGLPWLFQEYEGLRNAEVHVTLINPADITDQLEGDIKAT